MSNSYYYFTHELHSYTEYSLESFLDLTKGRILNDLCLREKQRPHISGNSSMIVSM